MNYESNQPASDFANGLEFVEWNNFDMWLRCQRALSTPSVHPWHQQFRSREDTVSCSNHRPETDPPPKCYTKISHLRVPIGKPINLQVHETVRLRGVEAFRAASVRVTKCRKNEEENAEKYRKMIYRYMDVIRNSMALLQAIHFEVFAPDRPDLRFIVLPSELARNALEGEYFIVDAIDLMHSSYFAVRLGNIDYPVVWTTLRNSARKGTFTTKIDDRIERAYVLKERKPVSGTSSCVSEFLEEPENRNINRPEFLNGNDENDNENIENVLDEESTLRSNPVRSLAIRHHLWRSADLPQAHSIVLIKTRPTSAAHLYPVEQPVDPKLYVNLVKHIRTTATRPGRVVSAARAIKMPEICLIADRLGPFNRYGPERYKPLMESLFRLGSRFRCFVQPRADPRDAVDKPDDESIIVRTLTHSERKGDTGPLLDCLCRHTGVRPAIPDRGEMVAMQCADGSTLRMNAQQSRALLELCAAQAPARLACVQSAPGSGKTTVAAAAAARAAAPAAVDAAVSNSSTAPLLLLLSMQNVAVDQIGEILKGFVHRQRVYNMKSTDRLDPFVIAPYDFFDHTDWFKVEKWRRRKTQLDSYLRRGGKEAKEEAKRYRDDLDRERSGFEQDFKPTILLSTVELALNKMLRLGAMSNILEGVRRIIVDEASLLTEAAMFCLIRKFPEANFVLIGDKEQLPPFMYEEHIVGHELAGRSALDIAMSSHLTPALTIIDVYRAPQSLVEPYNRVAYDRQLVSSKTVVSFPLTDIGLVPAGNPQLLYIEVEGTEKRHDKSMSLYNAEELETLERLLQKFPPGTEDKIMIIAMYLEQKKKVIEMVGHKYSVLTVNSSQGKEKPIIIVLTTRTILGKDMHFFSCRKRCNVAISRQQEALIIMGSALLKIVEPWKTAVVSDDFTRISSKEI